MTSATELQDISKGFVPPNTKSNTDWAVRYCIILIAVSYWQNFSTTSSLHNYYAFSLSNIIIITMYRVN